MKITVLTENTSLSPELHSEHGLSLYIETEDKKILFDMGQTDLFEKNAEKLGVDISGVDIAVLAHGHYDHGGGLRRFIEINDHAPVYVSKFAFGDHYSTKYIGLDKTLADNSRLKFAGDYLKIDDKTELFSCNAEIDGEIKNDDFRHEQYMLITEGEKRVLISGCSHKGVLNLAEHFKPDVLVGGFHFMKLDVQNEKGREYLDEAARIMKESGIKFYTCHCTGEEQYSYLKNSIDSLEYLSCGSVTEI